MARVERGNVVLHVDDRDVQHYIKQGYNLTDEQGKVLQRCMPANVKELQDLYTKQTEQIAKLEEENAKLLKEIEELKSKSKTAAIKKTK